ncbi:MAG: hypothetical protein AAFV49_04885 [Pseudomonadota bacterium]
MRYLGTLRGSGQLEVHGAKIQNVHYALSIFERDGLKLAHGTICCCEEEFAAVEDNSTARMLIGPREGIEILIEKLESPTGSATFTLDGDVLDLLEMAIGA